MGIKSSPSLQMEVAIITRTQNRPLLLKRAVESVLGQTYQEWFHVIVNDGGDEATVNHLVEAFAERYAGRLLVIHNEMQLGMEASSNIGIKACGSDFIIIHDDDDSWSQEFLEITTSSLKKQREIFPDIHGAMSLINVINEKVIDNGIVTVSSMPHEIPWDSSVEANFILYSDILKANQFAPISFLYERGFAEKIGFYDESLEVLGDWDFNVRFIRRGDIWVVPEYLANYHVRDSFMPNSVIKNLDKHKQYAGKLKNKWLREDTALCGVLSSPVQNRGINPAVVDNMQKQLDIIYSRLERIENNINAALPTIHNLQIQTDIIYNRTDKLELQSPKKHRTVFYRK